MGYSGAMHLSRPKFQEDGWVGWIALPTFAGAGIACLLAAGLWLVPATGDPLALGRAEAALGLGFADRAARSYAALGRRASPVRAHALERAAQVHELERNDHRAARRLLLRRLALGGSPAELARIRERLATSFLADRELRRAAIQFAAAHDADPEGPRAAALLTRAAELRWANGEAHKARTLWNELMELHPDHAGRAQLGLGEIALGQGRPAAALSPFQKASRSSDPAIASAARLGLAACYERLGELDGALAELDQAALPYGVWARRQAGLRDRAAIKGQP